MQNSNLKYFFQKRLYLIAIFILILMVLIIIKFFYIQILQHNYFSEQAKNNSIKITPIPPKRGLIVDRNNKILAENRITHNLEIDPSKNFNIQNIANQLKPFIPITNKDIDKYHAIVKNDFYSTTVPLKTDLSNKEIAIFVANQYQFKHIKLQSRLKRFYPMKEYTSHVVGYINRMNTKDIETLKKDNRLSLYKGTDNIGKNGIEQSYEHLIHGIPGFKKIEVDVSGNTIRTISQQEPINGQDLKLSIDIELQKIAMDALQGKKGALVAISPENGEVLSYVSQPSFDPNLFVGGIDHKNWNLLNNNKKRPMLDRVIKGVYPPGSTIKPFIAIAGLSHDFRVPPYQISDPGYFTMPNNSKTFRDWKRDGHGLVDVVKAIAVSCDTFFYGLGLDLGVRKMNQTLSSYGFGKKTGIDIKGEKSGLIADEKWKKNARNERWFAGETAITAIGQGFSQVTPIQLAHATAKIALPNNINYSSPFFLLNSKTPKQKMEDSTPTLPVKENILDLVKKGMVGVTQPGGTAAFLSNAPYSIAAKTGTAQVFGLAGGEYIEEDLPEHLKDHALFIAYAPAEKPKLAIAIIVENGGHGGSTAGPIAKKIFDYYLLNK